MEAAAGIDDWCRGEPAQRDDLVSLLREADDALGLEALEPPEYSLALLSQMDDQDLFVFRLYLAGLPKVKTVAFSIPDTFIAKGDGDIRLV